MPATDSLPPILLVDDNANDVFLAKCLLEEAQIKNPVLTFDDGKEATDFLETVARVPGSALVPCVVFVDLKMARMDGFNVIARIRERSEFDGMRVVVLTGSAVSEAESRALRAGADGFYVKFPPSYVIAQIVAGASGTD